jgi:dipeptidyl aminopeptidase/acylaminoacyl peptidase
MPDHPTMRHLLWAAVLVLLSSLGLPQEKTIPVPAGVTVEGIPPVPQSIADDLAKYAQFRSAQMQAWHPSKRQIVITTTFGATPQLHLVDGPGRDRRQITWISAGVSVEQSVPSFDPADGNTLVFMFDPQGRESRSIYRYDLTTGQSTLAVPAQSKYTPVWAKQGKWLAYDSNERNGKDFDLYVVQPTDPTTKRRLGEFEGAWIPWDWSPDGKSLIVNESISNDESYLWLVNVQTGEKRAVTARDGEKTSWDFAHFSSDGKRIYAVSDRGGEMNRVWRCDLATGAWTPITSASDNVDMTAGYELSPDGSQIAVAFDRGAGNEIQVLDLGTMKPRSMPSLPKGLYSRLCWRPGSRELGFTLASTKSQGDVYSLDTSLGTLTRWTFSETTFNTDVLPYPEIVDWKSTDGTNISGVLYKPPAKFSGRRPVLVLIHGGPAGRDRPVFRGRSNYFLNELGVALLAPNVRGSIGYGRKFQDMDNGRGRDGAIKDIGAMLDWIGMRPDLDPGKVVLSGGSYGGWLALEAGIVYNDRIRGIIEGAGITDFVTFLEQQPPARQVDRRAEYGDERDPQMREYLKSISPVTRASELKKPTLILHPAKDPRVPVTQAQELVRALKANNATVWYAEFADANHDNFPGTRANNDYMIATWIMFVKQFVLNDTARPATNR